MSQLLIDKLRKSRETNITVGAYTFTVRRPTDMEVMEMRGASLKQGDILQKYVVGWAGINELDIFPGGDPVPAKFDSDLFIEWAADRPNLWAPLIEAILSAYDDHQKKMEASLGEHEVG